jgi:hypothetical protein
MNIRSIKSLKGKKMRKAVFYGHAIPYLEDIEIKGRFIIIEGPMVLAEVHKLNCYPQNLKQMVMPYLMQG